MFRIRLLAIAVCILPWSASEAAAPATAMDGQSGAWRQTNQGWERAGDLFAPVVHYRQPALHPTVVAALEALLTMTAMLALSTEAKPAEYGSAGFDSLA